MASSRVDSLNYSNKWDSIVVEDDDDADDKSTWTVADPSEGYVEPEEAELEGRADSMTAAPAIGSVVILEGLVAAPKYNGKKGHIISGRICESTRVAVQLLDADVVLQVKPGNLCNSLLDPRPATEDLFRGRASLVEDGLWVGDCLAGEVARGRLGAKLEAEVRAAEVPWARDLLPCEVVCCASELCGGEGKKCVEMAARDAAEEKIDTLWGEPLRFVLETLDQQKTVLLYCMQGRSRSVALALAVMVKRGSALKEAWATMRAARPQVRLNLGFAVSLLRLENLMTAQPPSISLAELYPQLTQRKLEHFKLKAENATRAFLKTLYEQQPPAPPPSEAPPLEPPAPPPTTTEEEAA